MEVIQQRRKEQKIHSKYTFVINVKYDYHDLPPVLDANYKKNKSKILKKRSQGKSTAEIESLIGVNRNIIYRNLVLDREIIPSDYIFSILMSEILMMFNNGESLRSIGRFYGVAESAISSNLEKIGAHKVIPLSNMKLMTIISLI